MINEPDLSILLTAQPRFLQDELSGQAPTLPSFQESHQQVNDPRRPRPIEIGVTAKGGGDINAKLVSFLVPTNGAFGFIQVYTSGPITELT